MAEKIDIALWHQCTASLPKQPVPPHAMPFRCRDVDGNRVFLVDGGDIMIRPDKPADDEHPHMDFTQGANDMEAAWVGREFGKKVLLVDATIIPRNRPFNLYHEAYERRLMAQGMSYNRAHLRANAHERMLRITVKGGQRATQRTA
jgi:hypothetical protein